MQCNVFVSGGTGYIGGEFIRRLVARGHKVKALARAGSERKLPPGCSVVRGNALVAASYAQAVSADDTFVHLVGVPHPAPWKADQFRTVDLEALRASVTAAAAAAVPHFVFVSVAHPAPAMRAYVEVRKECEQILARSGLAHTILRPWYVLGPGHRWPQALQPFYAMAERMPSLAGDAERLGLLQREEMVSALGWAVENPPRLKRILSVPEIRAKAASWPPSWQPRRSRDGFAIPSTDPGSGPGAVSVTSVRTHA